MFKKLLVVFIVAASLMGLIGAAAALFTDTDVVGNNLFTAGTIILNTNPITKAVTLGNMAPGDQFTVPIEVTNDGTLALRYDVTSVTTDDGKHLAGQLDLIVKSGTTATGCDDAGFAEWGTSVYALGDLGSEAGIALVSDRPLAEKDNVAGDSEFLCLNIKLPSGTGNAYQAATTTATFTFASEQTKNN
jgi:predicted ribosomally synthesized peptide with SipW-like signal peptide